MDLKPDKVIFWKEKNAVYEASGLKQEEFCKLHELSLSQFKDYRQKLSDAQKKQGHLQSHQDKSGFVSLTPGHNRQNISYQLTLKTTAGLTLHLEIANLSDLLSLLKELQRC